MEGPELVVYAGGMAGGKTGQAVLEFQRLEAGTHFGQRVFQPKNAVREGVDGADENLISRSGPKISANIIPENDPREILRRIQRPELFVS